MTAEEYWIVDPGAGAEDTDKFVSVLELSNGSYLYRAYVAEKEIPIISFPGCSIDSWRGVHTPPFRALNKGMYPESNSL